MGRATGEAGLEMRAKKGRGQKKIHGQFLGTPVRGAETICENTRLATRAATQEVYTMSDVDIL